MDQSNNQQASGPQTSNPQVGGPQQEGDYKIGAGGCLQECDSWGRYSGPCGGSVSLADGSMTFFDGQTLYAAAADGQGGISGGNQVRGPVTPPPPAPVPDKSPAPPPPSEPHLTYSQEQGELRGPNGEIIAKGHAGQGEGLNNPDAEGKRGQGPLPRGNWRIEKMNASKWPGLAFHLVPDQETRQRVLALGRDPDSFYIHAEAAATARRTRDSQGCIALPKPDRIRMQNYDKRWLRVVR